jgi:hypothetical protein
MGGKVGLRSAKTYSQSFGLKLANPNIFSISTNAHVENP